MRPPTHTDPNAIPRNGTDVPWVELTEPRPDPRDGRDHADGDRSAAGGRRRVPG